MGYRLLYDNQILFDPYTNDMVTDASLTLKTNSVAYFDFTISPKHSLYNIVAERAGNVTLYFDNIKLFAGEISDIDTDIETYKTISCSGSLAYLEDTIVRPYSTVSGEQSLTAPSSVDGYFQWLIDQHNNNCLDSRKMFTVGVNQGYLLDTNNYIYRSSEQRPTTASEIEDKILDSLGGYLFVRYKDDLTVLDLYADAHEANTQIIDFGINITDFSKTVTASELYTAVVATGYTPDPPEGQSDKKMKPITLEDIADGGTPYSNIVKDGDRVYNVDAVQRYGYREYYASNTDIETYDGLLSYACRLLNTLISPSLSVTVKAVDLALYMHNGYEHFQLGQAVRVRSKPHNIDEYLMVNSITLDLQDPGNTEYELGVSYDTLTGQQSSYLKSLNSSINSSLDTVSALGDDVKNSAKVAKEAKDLAGEATDTANSASSKADQATETANTANTTANAASSKADQATETANTASSKANEATSTANAASTKADQANETADIANTTAMEANEKSNEAVSKANSAEATANEAHDTATEANKTANVASSKADNAMSSAANANTKADAAIDTANAANSNAEAANKKADDTAQTVAVVKKDVESANTSASNAQTAADAAKTAADNAQSTADTAKTNAAKAQTAADEAASSASKANTAASKAQDTADAANTAIANTNKQVSAIESEITQVKSDASTMRDELSGQIETVKTTMTTDYAKKTELEDTKTSLSTEISQSAAGIRTEVSQTYATKKSLADTATVASNAQMAADKAQAAADTNAKDLASAVTKFNDDVSDLQSQIDGSITTWFEDGVPSTENYPASDWDTDAKRNAHLGDLYYDNNTGYAYRYLIQNGVYQWKRIVDSDVEKALADAAKAQNTANTKRRIFVTTPVPPYDVADLWVQGDTGDILRCATAKSANQTYAAADWVKASKYTDDTAVTSLANTVSVTYATKTSVNQLSDRIEQTVQSVETVKTDTAAAQATADDAVAKANAAQSTADTAKVNAANAQKAADTAKSAADTAQTAANNAKKAADTAQNAADSANADLATAKKNLEDVQNQANATDEQVAVAKAAVDKAQAAADKANAAAATAKSAADTAQSTADAAKANAETAQSTANTAVTNASSAQTAADNAKKAADAAQSDVDSLKSRVTTAETSIKQNSDAIALRATKTEVTSAVNDISVGGRNLCGKFTFTNGNSNGIKVEITDDGFIWIHGRSTSKVSFGCGNWYSSRREWAAGTVITMSVSADDLAKMIKNNVYLQLNQNGGNVILTGLGISNKVTKSTATVDTNTNKTLYGFVGIHANAYDEDIDLKVKVKLELGNKATDWTPAPEDVDSSATAKADQALADAKSYSDAQLKISSDSITSTVSKTYATKSDLDTTNTQLSQVKQTAEQVQSNLANNYTTTNEMNSRIEQTASSITSSVSENYATKAALNATNSNVTKAQGTADSAVTKANNAQSTADGVKSDLASNYSTTTDMNSAIKQTADGIRSDVSKTYTTKAEFDNLSIGGRNLCLRTGEALGRGGSTGISFENLSNGVIKVTAAENNANWFSTSYKIPDDVFDAIADQASLVISYDCKIDSGAYARAVTVYINSGNGYYGMDNATEVSTDWHRIYAVVKKNTRTGDNSWVHFGFSGRVGTYYIRHLKIELGNKATDWSPAPEDITSEINAVDAKFTNYSTTEQMNSAIEQSASGITSTVSKTYATKATVEALQNIADNAIESWFGDVVPTLTNEPASKWNTTELKKQHAGDLYYDRVTGYSYRWTLGSDGAYSWEQIRDTGIAKALQDAANAQNTANTAVSKADTAQSTADTVKNNLSANYSTTTEMNSTISQTAEGIRSDVSKTYTTKTEFDGLTIGGRNLLLNTDVSISKPDSAQDANKMFNFSANPDPIKYLRNATISFGADISLKAAYGTDSPRVGYELMIKYVDGTYGYYGKWIGCGSEKDYNGRLIETVKTQDKDIITYNFGIYIQRLTSGTASIARPKIELGTKSTDWTPAPEDIDSSISAVDGKFANYSTTEQMNSAISQSAEGITSTVSKTYATKTELGTTNSNVTKAQQTADEVKSDLSTNYSTTTDMNSAIKQSADTITSNVSKTYATKTDFNNMSVGGRNLLATSKMNKNSYLYSIREPDAEGYLQGGTSDGRPWSKDQADWQLELDPGTYILSWEVKTATNWIYQSIRVNYAGVDIVGKVNTKPFNVTGIQSMTIVLPESTSKDFWLMAKFANESGTPGVVRFWLKRGTKSTDWSPAPEDISNSIDTIDAKFANYSTTEQMNSAISQSADSITSTVSKSYATKTELNTTNSNVATAQSTANAAKTAASNAQSTADTAKTNAANAQTTANNAQSLANAKGIDYSQGKMLYTDPTFLVNLNGTEIYANSGGENINRIRATKSADNPFANATHEMVIKVTGDAVPGLGGFYFGNKSRANAVFIVRIIAKIPTGYTIQNSHNPLGVNGSNRWLTSQDGTGKFQEYICKVTCGATGEFNTANHIWIKGTAATTANPVTWYVAYATVFDMTDVGDIQTTSNDLINYKTTVSNTYATKSALTQTSESIRSDVSKTYTTKTEFEKLSIGGTNLLYLTKDMPVDSIADNEARKYTLFMRSAGTGGSLARTADGIKLIFGANTNTSIQAPLASFGNVQNGDTVTLSFTYRGNITLFGQFYFLQKTTPNAYQDGFPDLNPDGQWHEYTHTFSNAQANVRTCTSILMFYALAGYDSTKWVEIKSGTLKLERGTRATDWSPAPEDLEDSITAVDDKFADYSTTTEVNSSISQTADAIRSDVSKTYQVKGDYATNSSVASAIEQSANAITSTVSETYATKSTVDALKNIADNAIESWTGTVEPTLTNEPASKWNTAELKKQHAGDLYYNKTTGYSYRFGSTDGTNYTWDLVRDTGITKALEDAAKAQQTANTAKSGVDKLNTDIPNTYATKSSLTQTANDITSTVSKTYATKTEFNNLDVSNVNLISNSTGNLGTVFWNPEAGNNSLATERVTTLAGYTGMCLKFTFPNGSSRFYHTTATSGDDGKGFSHVVGKTYTLSAIVKSDIAGTAIFCVGDDNQRISTTDLTAGTWTNVEATYTATGAYSLSVKFTGKGSLFVCQLMLGYGNKAVNWVPAEYDTQYSLAATNNKFNNYYTKTETNSQIKQSADSITSTVASTYLTSAAAESTYATKSALTQTSNSLSSSISSVSDKANSTASDLANYKTIKDTRNDNQNPQWYCTNYPKQSVREFKYANVLGITGTETYGILTTNVPWPDSSGGYPKQTFEVNDKRYWRVGSSATTWSDWYDVTGSISETQDYISAGLNSQPTLISDAKFALGSANVDNWGKAPATGYLECITRDTSVKQNVTVTPGDRYYFEAEFDTTNMTGTSFGFGFAYLKTDGTRAWTRAFGSTEIAAGQHKSGYLTVPSNATAASPWFQIDGTTPLGSVKITYAQVTNVTASHVEMNSAITQLSDSITSTVSKTYATKGELDTTNGNVAKAQDTATTANTNAQSAQSAADNVKDNLTNNYLTSTDIANTYTTQTQFTQTASEIRMDFNTIINSNYDDLNDRLNESITSSDEQFATINKYIHFVDGKIILGESANPLTLTIQNDRVSFTQSGNEIAYFSDEKLYVRQAEILTYMRIGNYEFQPRNDGSLALRRKIG